jgi:hypothetical protein
VRDNSFAAFWAEDEVGLAAVVIEVAVVVIEVEAQVADRRKQINR